MSARKATKYDRYQKSGAKSEIYSDFDNSFLPHPFTGQISRRTNVDAVKMALRNLIFTNKYERLRNPDFGGNIRRYLFETFEPTTAKEMEEEIRSMIENYEPRAGIVQIKVTPDEDNNSMNIRIVFRVNMVEEKQEIELTLYRVR